MILSAHQPAYLPWLGYFEKIARSDIFVFLDTVQFEKNSFTNRNKIKTANGPAWLTIPVKKKGHMSSTMLDTEIDNSTDWRTKHLRAIELNYKKCPMYDLKFRKLSEIINLQNNNLADYCFSQTAFWCSILGIGTKIVRSSSLNIHSSKSELVLDLCKYFSADEYISGTLGRNYLDVEVFEENGISVVFQSYNGPIYPQRWGNFVENLSVVDYWFNSGTLELDLFNDQ